mmetsp:Transcript_113638/g.253578  ORF Transcript_113638/g.253578 Transcript_113638/m.253578 type:complete len:234 (+) Transcript_113638:631-1332(+)
MQRLAQEMTAQMHRPMALKAASARERKCIAPPMRDSGTTPCISRPNCGTQCPLQKRWPSASLSGAGRRNSRQKLGKGVKRLGAPLPPPLLGARRHRHNITASSIEEASSGSAKKRCRAAGIGAAEAMAACCRDIASPLSFSTFHITGSVPLPLVPPPSAAEVSTARALDASSPLLAGSLRPELIVVFRKPLTVAAWHTSSHKSLPIPGLQLPRWGAIQPPQTQPRTQRCTGWK